VKSDGTVWVWGGNSHGQLGDGTTTERHSPVQVVALNDCVAVAAGDSHSLAVKSDGTVWAWGQNNSGKLGDGTTIDRHAPVYISGLSGCVAVGGGWLHSLAVKSDGTVWAWGNNDYGQLGDGTTTDRHMPVQVSGLTGGVTMAAGLVHSLALKVDGTVWAWGGNGDGRLGDGTTIRRHTPVQVSGLTDCIRVVAGGYHSLGLKSDGTVWAWGNNESGQLGDGTTAERHIPVQTNFLMNVTAMAAGWRHSLALIGPSPTYELAVNADPSERGIVIVFPDKPVYNYGASVTLEAIANSGSMFLGWNGLPSGAGSGSVSSGGAFISFVITEDLQITAHFGPQMFRLEYGPHPGGEIIGSPEGDYSPDAGILLVANPAEGYRFVKWVVNGVDAGESPMLGFQMDSDKTVEAVFAYQCTLTVIGGSGSGVYDEGTEVEIVADVPPGRVFDQWTGDVGTVADVHTPTTTIVVNGDYTLTIRLMPLLQAAVATEDDLDWVYQNTPLCLGNGGHKVRLSVNVLDYGENDSVEVTVANVPGSGPGEVTVDDDPGGDPLVKYIVGSMRTDGMANTGPLTLEVTVTGNVSEAVTVELPFTVRRLGDIDGNGAPETADVSLVIMELNGYRAPGYHDNAFDIDANGGAEPGDVQILMNVLNGLPVP